MENFGNLFLLDLSGFFLSLVRLQYTLFLGTVSNYTSHWELLFAESVGPTLRTPLPHFVLWCSLMCGVSVEVF